MDTKKIQMNTDYTEEKEKTLKMHNKGEEATIEDTLKNFSLTL